MGFVCTKNGALWRADQGATAYDLHARHLDERHHGAGPVHEQRRLNINGPVRAVLRGMPTVVGLVVGSFAESNDAVHALADEAADRKATRWWKLDGFATQAGAKATFKQQIMRHWSCGFWRAWAKFMRTRAARVHTPPGHLLGGSARLASPDRDRDEERTQPITSGSIDDFISGVRAYMQG